MKANSKRKVFGDAVDLLMGDMEEVTMPRGVQMLPVKSIQPFHDHPFHLYEGERLDDMIANGAVYSDDGDEIVIHDQKLDALEDMIEAANGRPVMVAYWFKHDLSRIMRRLTEKKIPFEKLDSEESIRKWNRGELPVALIHPASAGHGLNLQSGGNTLIWFGLTWSLELYQQTVARLWRQGQTAETVVVQHIITAGTIDEDVMKALANKDMTQNRLIAAVKARVTHGR